MAKPWKIPYLNPGDKLKVCLPKILTTRIRETFSYEEGTIEGSDIEALHNMRVSTRRLQSTMKIFRDCFPQKKFKYHYRKIRRLLRLLGQIRDYDVFIDRLERYRQALPQRDRAAVELLIARQKNLRFKERRVLLRELRALREESYQHCFVQFVAEAL